jgi:hypothetical protein
MSYIKIERMHSKNTWKWESTKDIWLAYLSRSTLIITTEKISENKKTEDPYKQKIQFYTNKYRLQISGAMVQICKNCFLKTMDESNKFIINVIAKPQASVSGMASVANRGCHEAYNKTTDADKARLYNILSQYQPTRVTILDSLTKCIYYLITLLPEHMKIRSYTWTAELSV